jgi:hypothetical protein
MWLCWIFPGRNFQLKGRHVDLSRQGALRPLIGSDSRSRPGCVRLRLQCCWADTIRLDSHL